MVFSAHAFLAPLTGEEESRERERESVGGVVVKTSYPGRTPALPRGEEHSCQEKEGEHVQEGRYNSWLGLLMSRTIMILTDFF